jgi:hypothetical protein
MTRTLVIQLGRLGDIIQTSPLLSELAASGDHVDVLALRPQHEVLLGCPAVANIITIPESLKPLDDAIACGFPMAKSRSKPTNFAPLCACRSSIASSMHRTRHSAAGSQAQSLARIPTLVTAA